VGNSVEVRYKGGRERAPSRDNVAAAAAAMARWRGAEEKWGNSTGDKAGSWDGADRADESAGGALVGSWGGLLQRQRVLPRPFSLDGLGFAGTEEEEEGGDTDNCARRWGGKGQRGGSGTVVEGGAPAAGVRGGGGTAPAPCTEAAVGSGPLVGAVLGEEERNSKM
jgi:hypothetical protein